MGRGTFGGKFGACHCNQWDLTAYVCDSAAKRPSFQITLGKHVLRLGVVWLTSGKYFVCDGGYLKTVGTSEVHVGVCCHFTVPPVLDNSSRQP